MLDVKETLKKSEERMEMAAMFLEDELNPCWTCQHCHPRWRTC